jgi:hypothetical protein
LKHYPRPSYIPLQSQLLTIELPQPIPLLSYIEK